MNREVSENTFREYHDQLVDTAFPRRLRSACSGTTIIFPNVVSTYACFAWDTNLPLKEVHGAIGGLCRFSIEALDNA